MDIFLLFFIKTTSLEKKINYCIQGAWVKFIPNNTGKRQSTVLEVMRLSVLTMTVDLVSEFARDEKEK